MALVKNKKEAGNSGENKWLLLNLMINTHNMKTWKINFNRKELGNSIKLDYL